jgi:hypothetical protein
MKKSKNYNYLCGLAILSFIIIGILIAMKIKEPLVTKSIIPPTNFISTNKILDVPINSSLDIPVTLLNGLDYSNNEIQTYDSISYTDCFTQCANNNLCKGIVTNFEQGKGPGYCSLKSKMDVNSIDPSKYSTKFNR